MRYQVTALFESIFGEVSRSEAEHVLVDKGPESAVRKWQWRLPPAEQSATVRLIVSAPILYRYGVYQVYTSPDVEFVRLNGGISGLIDGRPQVDGGRGIEKRELTESEAVEIVRNEVGNWMVKKFSSSGILITLGSGDRVHSAAVVIKEGDDEHMVRLRTIKAMRTLQDEIAGQPSAELSRQPTMAPS